MKLAVRMNLIKIGALVPVLAIAAVWSYAQLHGLKADDMLYAACLSMGLSCLVRMHCDDEKAQFGLGAAAALNVSAIFLGIAALDTTNSMQCYVIVLTGLILLALDFLVQMSVPKGDVTKDPLLSKFGLAPDETVRDGVADFAATYDLVPADREFLEMQASMAMFIKEAGPADAAAVFERLERLKQLMKLDSVVRSSLGPRVGSDVE